MVFEVTLFIVNDDLWRGFAAQINANNIFQDGLHTVHLIPYPVL